MAATSSSENPLTAHVHFQHLIERGCQILHHFDGLDWNVDNKLDNHGGNTTTVAGGDVEAVMNNEAISSDDDDQSDSSSDDGMMMFGGGLLDSDSEDDDVAMDEDEDDYCEEENGDYCEEEDAALLKRASSVHVALLSSSPSLVKDGEELVTTLISSLTSSTTLTNDDVDVNKLITTISNILLQSSTAYLPKRMSSERKRKIGLTNSLLAVQYLLHVLDTSSSSTTTASSSAAASLLGWKLIILPLLFNNNTKLDEALQTALLNLISPTSIKVTNDQLGYCEDVCQLCLMAVDQLTTTTAAATFTTTAAVVNNQQQRQSQLVLVCNVLIRLHDGMTKLMSKQQQHSGGGTVDGELTSKCVESVASAIHLIILKVIRGICYATPSAGVDTEKCVMLDPLLSLEAVRPITGMLLPTLYPPDGSDSSLKEQQEEVRVVELWNEILRLLSPCSEEVLASENRKCCQNW